MVRSFQCTPLVKFEIWNSLCGCHKMIVIVIALIWTAVRVFFRSPLCLARGLRNQVLQPFLSLVFR
jgi:hypothetical protein